MSGTDGVAGRAAPDGPEDDEERVDVLAPRTRSADHEVEFTAFMADHAGDLRRTAWLLVGDLHRAEELTQETLARTYASWGRARRGDPLAYARRVLANLRIDTWRRRRREVLTAPDGLPDEVTSGGQGRAEDRDQLVRALALLNSRQRRVVVLRHLVGMSEAEVAADLGISVGTVKSSSSRALATMRAALSTEGEQR